MKSKTLVILLVLFVCRVGVTWEPTFWFGGGSAFDNINLISYGDLQNTQIQQEFQFDPGLMLTSGLTLTLTPQLALNVQAGFLKNTIGFSPYMNNLNLGRGNIGQNRIGGGPTFKVGLTSMDISPMVRAYLTQHSPSVYVGVGANISFLLQCRAYYDIHQQQSGTSFYNEQALNCLKDDSVQSSSFVELERTMDIGLLVGAGISSMYSENMYISLDVAYKYGLTSLPESKFSGVKEIKRNAIIALVHVGVPI